MKTKLKTFHGGDIYLVTKNIENFLKNNPNIRVTAMVMTFDAGSKWHHTLLTYEEGE